MGGRYQKLGCGLWKLQDREHISPQGPLVEVGTQRPSFQRASEEVKCKVGRETLVPLELPTGLNMSIGGEALGSGFLDDRLSGARWCSRSERSMRQSLPVEGVVE